MIASLGVCAVALALAGPEAALTGATEDAALASAWKKTNNPALQVLDLACEHVLGGGICDFRFARLTTSLQKQLDNDQRLQHTDTVSLCGLADTIIAHPNNAGQGQHSAKEYCQMLFENASTTIDAYRYRFDLSWRFDLS